MKAVDKKNQSFWIVNISKMNVCLSDLGLTVPAGRSFNLLDKKHFSYTLKQLEKSKESGSLHKKRDRIRVCDNQPEFPTSPMKELSQQPIQTKLRSVVKVVDPKFEELEFSDEEYADEMSVLFDKED